MMRSMFSGVSGLQNMQTAMDVLGNNIANVNTVGFKSGNASFKELFTQVIQGASTPTSSLGGVNPMQIGLGVNLSSMNTNMSQGQMETTGVNTNLAINGNGFFIVNSGGNTFYSRDGEFNVDANGDMVNSAGNFVQGWMATNGVLPSNPSGTNMASITIPQTTAIPAQATSAIGLAGNLAGGQGNIVPAISGNIGTNNGTNGTSWSTPTISVNDAAGKAATFKLTFTYNTTVPVHWDWTANTNGGTATAVTGAGTLDLTTTPPTVVTSTPVTLATPNGNMTITPDFSAMTQSIANAGTPISTLTQPTTFGMPDTVYDSLGNAHQLTVNFQPNGVANEWNWVALDGTTNVGSGMLTFNNLGALSTATANTISFTPSGANPISATLDFTKLTQYAATTSSVSQATNNGYASGALGSFTVDSTGTITGSFSNGQNQIIGQVALANFNNPTGLTDVGNNLFQASNNSGTPQVGTSNTGGRGNINSGSLEMSNENLAADFVNMITAERAYQANAQTISQSSTLLQTLVGLPGPVP